MHSTNNLDDGYLGSGKRLGYSRKKHGDENHKREILEHCSSRSELKQRESEIVDEKMLADPLCMNIARGGEGGFRSKSHRKAFLNSSRTAKLKGTEQAKRLTAKALETKRERGTMFVPPPESRIGSKHRSQWHGRVKATMAERKHQQGEKNSQFGTCWVTDGVKPIKIEKDQLDEYLYRGYSRGRKKFAGFA